jgi:hypothetical protein
MNDCIVRHPSRPSAANRAFALATSWRTKAEHLNQKFKETNDRVSAAIAKEVYERCAEELEEMAREI